MHMKDRNTGHYFNHFERIKFVHYITKKIEAKTFPCHIVQNIQLLQMPSSLIPGYKPVMIIKKYIQIIIKKLLNINNFLNIYYIFKIHNIFFKIIYFYKLNNLNLYKLICNGAHKQCSSQKGEFIYLVKYLQHK